MKAFFIPRLLWVAIACAATPPAISQPVKEIQVVRPQPPIASARQRLLPLKGGQNFRDLGGYRTADGRHVRWGLLYRSGSMHGLTAADYAYLQKLGIRTVCDLRDTRERRVEPVDWPKTDAPRVLADDYDSRTLVGGGLVPNETVAQARAGMTRIYPRILEGFNRQYRRMFGELLAGRAPLAFNCSAGKDRTGVAAALILMALNVPRETIVKDYLLTNRYFDVTRLSELSAKEQAQMAAIPANVLHARMRADRRYIQAIFRVMDRHPQGSRGYLRDKLGLGPRELARLRAMYTE